MEKRTLLIDGDILVYSICSATEYVARFDDETDVAFCNIPETLAICESTVEGWRSKWDAGMCVIAFTGKNNFRKEIYPSYKAHRKSCRKPCGYKPIKELLGAKYSCREEPALEGDDILGLLATEGTYYRPIIISSDKDLRSIPGELWNPEKDSFEKICTSEADRNWLMQVLTGDKTDGYPGLEGVGPVTAAKILKDGTWTEVLDAYKNAGFNEEYALTQARCARILRHTEYNWETKEVRLWTPR